MGARLSGHIFCKSYGYRGDPETPTKGSFAVEVILRLCCLIPEHVCSFGRPFTLGKGHMSVASLRALVVLVACSLPGFLSAENVKGRVVAIADGDTITVLGATTTQHKTRLAGIDAPEKSQAFGQRSKDSLSDLVFNREVEVETSKRDRYGREVGKVLVNGIDANLEQIRRGMAWHYKAYQNEQSAEDREAYARAEEAARRATVGLWADAEPVPPWMFRHKNR